MLDMQLVGTTAATPSSCDNPPSPWATSFSTNTLILWAAVFKDVKVLNKYGHTCCVHTVTTERLED